MDKWIMCIVALILGMLIADMLKNVCGCKTVEGHSGDYTHGCPNEGDGAGSLKCDYGQGPNDTCTDCVSCDWDQQTYSNSTTNGVCMHCPVGFAPNAHQTKCGTCPDPLGFSFMEIIGPDTDPRYPNGTGSTSAEECHKALTISKKTEPHIHSLQYCSEDDFSKFCDDPVRSWNVQSDCDPQSIIDSCGAEYVPPTLEDYSKLAERRTYFADEDTISEWESRVQNSGGGYVALIAENWNALKKYLASESMHAHAFAEGWEQTEMQKWDEYCNHPCIDSLRKTNLAKCSDIQKEKIIRFFSGKLPWSADWTKSAGENFDGIEDACLAYDTYKDEDTSVFGTGTPQDRCTHGYGRKPCQHGGTIKEATGPLRKCGCECPPGYSGNNCEIVAPCIGHGGKVCQNGGVMVNNTPDTTSTEPCARARCNCTGTGYKGPNCEEDEGGIDGRRICCSGKPGRPWNWSCLSGNIDPEFTLDDQAAGGYHREGAGLDLLFDDNTCTEANIGKPCLKSSRCMDQAKYDKKHNRPDRCNESQLGDQPSDALQDGLSTPSLDEFNNTPGLWTEQVTNLEGKLVASNPSAVGNIGKPNLEYNPRKGLLRNICTEVGKCQFRWDVVQPCNVQFAGDNDGGPTG